MDFLFSFPSDTCPALRVTVNRETRPHRLDVGDPRPANLGHMVSELLLVPCSWFPPFGNVDKLVEMCPEVICSPECSGMNVWIYAAPKPLFLGFHAHFCTGHPPRWSVPSLGGPTVLPPSRPP